MHTRIVNISRKLTVLMLVVALLFGSFFNVRKAEAIPAAIPAAGAALAALAAELGVSETVLIAAIGTIAAAGTGLAFYSTSGTDTSLSPAPGFEPWDDLTPDEKQAWVGQDGTALDYQKQTIGWWALQYGLLEQTPNGGLEPTPDPQNGNTPDWQKKRNIIVALASGAGGVLLYDALAPLVDNASGGIKELLFGSGTQNASGLAIPITYTVYVSGKPVYFKNPEIFGSNTRMNNWPGGNESTSTINLYPVSNTSTYTMSKTNGYWAGTSSRSGTKYAYSKSNGSISSMSVNHTPISENSGGTLYFLNPFFEGGYNFGGIATYQNGLWSGDFTINSLDYGQMTDTPDELEQAVFNNNSYNTFINNYSDPGIDGYSRAVTIPQYILDGTPETPEFQDFVVTIPDENIQPVPDDEPLPGPNPDPNPDDPNTQFEEDLTERVGRLLTQPFDQLFPFCLIGDMRRLSEIFSDAAYSQPQGMRTQSEEPMNGTQQLVIPLSGFNVEGLDDFELDLVAISDLAHMVRPFLTALFITGLLAGTLKFFINRGGE